MSERGIELVLAAILDAITLLRGEVSAIADRQDEIQSRLDHIGAGLAPVTDVLPGLEMVLAHQDADRTFQTEMFRRTAELAALAHAAASGRPSTLPDDLADHPILERFAYFQPPERSSRDGALARWERTVKAASIEELTEVLKSQYTPSPSEFVDVRVLRFRMAAITRDELQSRGAPLPPAHSQVDVQGGLPMSKQARFAELATLWWAGDSVALQGEAELAAAVDQYAHTRARLLSEGHPEQLVEQVMAMVRKDTGDDIERGQMHARGSGLPPEGPSHGRDLGSDLTR